MDSEDPSLVIAAKQPKSKPKKAAAPSYKVATQGKLPSKPLPPAQAVKEARSGSARGYGRGHGAGGASYGDSKELSAPQGGFGKSFEMRGGYGGAREPSRGGRKAGFSNGEFRGDRESPPRRQFDRHSGTGNGNEMKREGGGQGNWGTDDEVAKEMTLKEYEKVLEEKRKSLQALKTEGRKVDAKEFESMQALSNRKYNDEIFIKLGSEKDKKKKLAKKEERPRKGLGELTIDVGGLDVKHAMKYLKLHLMFGVLFPTLSSIRVRDGSGNHGDDKLKTAIMNRLQKAGIPSSEEDPIMVIDGPMDFSFLDSDSDSD